MLLPERAPSAALPEIGPIAPETTRASLEAASVANAVIGGSAADSKDNSDDDAITRGESQALVDNRGAVVPMQVVSDALEKTDAEAVPESGLGAATGTAEEATTEPLGTGVITRKEQTGGGRGFSREGTFAAKTKLTAAIDNTGGATDLDGGILKANVACAAVSYTRAFCAGRESRGEGSKPEPLQTAATSVNSAHGSSVRVAPVLSLSGHLIGPEAMQGGGDGDGGAKNGCVEGWARDTFMREMVTWDDFARYPQV